MDVMGPLIWLANEREQGRAGDVDGVIQASIYAASYFNVDRRRSLLKYLNKDLKPLAEAEFIERGRYLFGDDFGKCAKSMADNVLALKGLHQKGKTPMQSRFSGSGDSNVKRFAYLKLPSRRQIGGAGSGAQRSVFNRLDQNPRGHPKSFRNAKNRDSDCSSQQGLPIGRAYSRDNRRAFKVGQGVGTAGAEAVHYLFSRSSSSRNPLSSSLSGGL